MSEAFIVTDLRPAISAGRSLSSAFPSINLIYPRLPQVHWFH
jgi:hypothetical protein